MKAENVLIRRDEVVSIHLRRLGQLAATENPGNAEAVQASISLRFLIDNMLSLVATAEGIDLKISAPDVTGVPITNAILFVAGGYTLGTHQFAAFYSYREPGLSSPFRAQFEAQKASSPKVLPHKAMTLAEFLDAPALGLIGNLVSRGELIRYVANRCGGAHHADKPARFERLDHLVTQIGHIVRENGEGISAVFLETLGAARLLTQAADIQRLLAILSPAATATADA